jgi:hypothetical protein
MIGSWVQWPTRIRRVNGTIACQQRDGQVQVLGLRSSRASLSASRRSGSVSRPVAPGELRCDNQALDAELRRLAVHCISGRTSLIGPPLHIRTISLRIEDGSLVIVR